MFKSIRQSMAWLHGWLGLLFGWIMFIIFLTGTTAYYKDHINLWAEPQLANIEYQQSTAIHTAYDYLQQYANNANEWYINLATKEKPINQVYWSDSDGFHNAILDPNQDEEILLDNELGLGDFLYRFHYQFHNIDIETARAIISLTAFMMLIVIISGIITHKKIFSDFFTLRAYKGQRSWLDVHNLSSVIALPFFLVITITGFIILFTFSLPQGAQQLYGDNKKRDYFREIREVQIQPQSSTLNNKPTLSAEMKFPEIVAQVQQQWGDAEIKRITVKNINQSNATIIFEQKQDNGITIRPARLLFNAYTAQLLENNRKTNTIALADAGVYGLHLAYFAQPLLRIAFFFSGLLGCVMIASGLLMWSIKRQIQHKGEESIGQFLVDKFNILFLLGLPLAIIAGFYGVRLHSMVDTSILNISYIACFFCFWIVSFALAILMPHAKSWTTQLVMIIALCALLPVLDIIYLLVQGHVKNIAQLWLFLRVDIWFVLFAMAGIWLLKNIQPMQQRIKQKISQKLEAQSTTQEDK